MLSARRLKFLSLALLMSGATIVLTQQWLAGAVRKAQADARASAPAAEATPARRVLVASGPIPTGSILRRDQLRWQAWPTDTPTAAYLTEANTRIDQVAGAVVRNRLEAGEPLSAARVVYPGDRSFLAAVLQPGYRAVTVNVSAATGVAGFVLPGDHIDLILSRPMGEAGDKRFVSETVLTDVRVVGMDQRSSDAKDPKKDVVIPQTATLEVTPKGAEVIAVVSELGKLSLSLRSLAAPDATAVETRVVTRTSDHEAVQAAVAAPRARTAVRHAAAPAGDRVEIVRGSESSSANVASSPSSGLNYTTSVTPVDGGPSKSFRVHMGAAQ